MLIQKLKDFPSLKTIPKIIALDTETESDRGGIEGFSFSYLQGKNIIGHYVPVNHYFDEFPDGAKYKNVDWDYAINYMKELISGRRIAMHNAQFDLTIIEQECGIKIPLDKVEDTMLIHWLLDTERKHGLKPIMNLEYGKNLPEFEAARAGKFINFARYAENDAKHTLLLFYKIYPDIKKRDRTFRLYRDWEIRTIPVLQDVNYKKNFIRIDKSLLSKYLSAMDFEMNVVDEIIKSKFGDINYNSTKQLAEALIAVGYHLERRAPTPKMIATAYAKGVEPIGNYILDEGALIRLFKRQKGLILSAILYNRKITKQYTTYVKPIYDSLQDYSFGDKKVSVLSGYDLMHTGTRTGRFSGHRPNLQNQPRESMLMKLMFMTRLKQEGIIHTEDDYWSDSKLAKWLEKNGKREDVLKIIYECSIDIRKIYIPMPGRVFIGGDYSQLELRMIAHLSGDKNMCEKFNRGADIHQETADDIAAVVKYPVSRQYAKPLNFGLIYGLFWTSLAESTGMSKKKAKQIYETYFKVFYGVAEFIEKVHRSTKKSHFVQTILGRRRNMDTVGINDYDRDSFMRRKNAENASVSTVVSGSSSDLIKIAMVRIFEQVKNIDIKLQIHDELLIEVDKAYAEKRAKQVKQIMEDAMQLKVPLVCDIKIGRSWRDVH